MQNFEFPYFIELLKCDHIHALEELIFQRMVQWVNYDEENRAEYVQNLLKLIRLEKIPKPVRL